MEYFILLAIWGCENKDGSIEILGIDHYVCKTKREAIRKFERLFKNSNEDIEYPKLDHYKQLLKSNKEIIVPTVMYNDKKQKTHKLGYNTYTITKFRSGRTIKLW